MVCGDAVASETVGHEIENAVVSCINERLGGVGKSAVGEMC